MSERASSREAEDEQAKQTAKLRVPLAGHTAQPSFTMKVPPFKHTSAMIAAAGSSPTGTSNAFDSAGNPFEHRVARAISACTRCRSRKSKVCERASSSHGQYSHPLIPSPANAV